MLHPTSLKLVKRHLDYAKDRLDAEKANLLSAYPLPELFNRHQYAFHYKAAETLGLKSIHDALSVVDWLPLSLDPSDEIRGHDRDGLRKWLASSWITTPDSTLFGHDYIHALARCRMMVGEQEIAGLDDRPRVKHMAERIGLFFRDFACLITALYTSAWMAEQGIDQAYLSNPSNIAITARELSMQSTLPDSKGLIQHVDNDLQSPGLRPIAPVANSMVVQAKIPPYLHLIHNRTPLIPPHDTGPGHPPH